MANAPPDPILARLGKSAGKSKRLRFDEFQEIALYDADLGYFAQRRHPAGREGDFITSPEISPIFAQVLARVIERDAAALDADDFHVVELGAGRGALARDLWDALRSTPLARRIRFHLVERSAPARATWPETLRSVPASQWAPYASDQDLPATRWAAGALLANEVFDNLPVRRVMQTQTLQEIVVRVRRTGLREELVPAPVELGAYLEAQGVRLAVGQAAEVCLEAPGLLSRLLARFHRSAAIVVDYGDEAKRLYDPSRFPNGSLAANRGHATHTDYYRDPGTQDLTAHVNFTPLLATLEAAGLRTLFFGTQTRFLLDHGFAESLQARLERTRDDFERLRLATRAKQLYHPEALGEAFRVLHARTP